VSAARITFGIIFLLGAVLNITVTAIFGPEIYRDFADLSFWPWYYNAWQAVAVPRMLLIIVLLIIFEICLGLLFILNRKYIKAALVLAILFCLGTAPVMVSAACIDAVLVLILSYLLWKELHAVTAESIPRTAE